ncbi:MAG: hypothetical protein ACOX2M_02870 [Fastidiosipilaceae bacterium]
MEKNVTPRPGYMGYDEYMALRKRQQQKANEAADPAPVAHESAPTMMPRRPSTAHRPTATSSIAPGHRTDSRPDRPRRQDIWAPSIDLDAPASVGFERFRGDPTPSVDSKRPEPWREDTFSPSPEVHVRPRRKKEKEKSSGLRLVDDDQRDRPFEDWLDTDGKLGSGKFESVPMEEALAILRRVGQSSEAGTADEQMDMSPGETSVASASAGQRADLDETTVVMRHPEAESFVPPLAPEPKTTVAPESKATVASKSKVAVASKSKATTEPEPEAPTTLESEATVMPESKAPVAPEPKAPLAFEPKESVTPESKESVAPESKTTVAPKPRATIEPESEERADTKSKKETRAVSAQMDPPSSEPAPQAPAAIRTVVFEPEVSRPEKHETSGAVDSVIAPEVDSVDTGEEMAKRTKPELDKADRQIRKETETAKKMEPTSAKIPIETRPASVLLPVDEDAEQNEPLFVPLDRRTGIILAGMALCVVAIIVLLVLFL